MITEDYILKAEALVEVHSLTFSDALNLIIQAERNQILKQSFMLVEDNGEENIFGKQEAGIKNSGTLIDMVQLVSDTLREDLP